MDLMPLQFRTLRYFGLWCGPHRQRPLVKYVWRPFVINLILFITISLSTATIFYRSNVDDFTESIFMNLTYLSLSLRLLNFLFRRDALEQLLKEFREKMYRPRNVVETNITTKYEKMITFIFYSHMVIAQLTGLAFLSFPLVALAIGKGELDYPIELYETCYKENPVCYSITYVLQVLGFVIGISVSIALDTIFVCSVLLICAQIDLCCHRFAVSNNINFEKSMKEFVKHQIFIRKIVRQLESFFVNVVVTFMLFCIITLCTSVYNVSKKRIGDPEAFALFMYFWCMIIQLLCYCWFGNELKLKSIEVGETPYNIDWIALKPSDRKSLWFIMLSCQREMSISLQGLLTISLEIFVWVLKASYAAYNLLKSVEARQ